LTVTAALPGGCSPSDPDAVREQLARILRSGPFQQSQRRQRFLRYLVDETLAGRGDRLKAYTIAVAVFDRPSTFDPVVDPVVRIEAGRLRDKLREYYDTLGQTDPIRIELPKGSYAPHIENQRDAVSAHGPDPIKAPPPEQLLGDAVAREPTPRRFAPFTTTGWSLAGLLAGAALLIAVASFWGSRRPPVPDNPSIAVLPFNNIGHNARWQRFADGITEDTITDLTRAKDLIVIARNSTEVYRDKPIDVRKIGRDLNVKYVLEGSIQPIGERIRVTAQLIDSASGSHVWSERYDRPADDLFALQSEVTQRIAATLMGYQGAVAEAERRLVRRKPPASLTAYDTYLLGIEAKHRVTKESLAEAESLLNKAIELDPQLARAYVALAEVQFYLIDLGLAPSFEGAVEKMMDAAEKAVTLDPDDGKTHLALGMAYMYGGKQEQAATELSRAEALASSDADVLICVAWSLPPLGQSKRAVALAERSLQLNPHYPDWYNQGLSYVYFFGGQYDKAAEYRLLVKKPLALDHAFAAVTYAYLDRPRDAEAAAASVLKLDPVWNAERYLSEGGGFADREAELFVDGARKAGLPSCMPSALLKDVPHFIRVKSCDRQRASTSG
jgi:TolB-like protein/Tfp pilus assembly protein PilF